MLFISVIYHCNMIEILKCFIQILYYFQKYCILFIQWYTLNIFVYIMIYIILCCSCKKCWYRNY